MSQRDKFVSEIRRLEAALNNTDSKYLKADYSKAIVRMRRELAQYDRFQAGGVKWQKQEG